MILHPRITWMIFQTVDLLNRVDLIYGDSNPLVGLRVNQRDHSKSALPSVMLRPELTKQTLQQAWKPRFVSGISDEFGTPEKFEREVY